MRPLEGKRILVTRPRAQAAALCERLAAAGAVPIPLATIEIAPPPDYAALDDALRRLPEFSWIIFTSANGVAVFWDRLIMVGADARPWAGLAPDQLQATARVAPTVEAAPAPRLAAIGPATARALAERGARADFVPAEYLAEAITAGLGDVAGEKILLPRADLAREALAVELARRGAHVEQIAAYRIRPAPADPAALAELRRGVDAITFTSSSAVRNLVDLVGPAPDPLIGPVIACIGPVTAGTARDLGLRVDVTAAEYTLDGLVSALLAYYSKEAS